MVETYVTNHPTGIYDSWEIVSEDIARKTCDKSFFQHRGSGVPQAMCWFFDAESIMPGERLNIILVYSGNEYEGRIEKTDNGTVRTRIFWKSALAELFAPFENDGKQHILEFHRIDDNKYEIEFMELAETKKVWLLTWNLDRWGWNDYKKDCKKTENGEVIKDTWACMSTKPQIGDEFFLMKLGAQPRGIIGHGIITSQNYECEHYDPEQAAAGKTMKSVDIEIDQLLNYEDGPYLKQSELVQKCGAQQWSPQGSGIEIKSEVLPTLMALWKEVTRERKEYGFDKIVSFLKDYTGQYYIAPEKAGDQTEYMTEMKLRGQTARQKFQTFGREIEKQLPDIQYVSCSNWINQGQTVQRYLWIEFKKEEWNNYPQSLSISVEQADDWYQGDDKCIITVRVDPKDISSGPEDYKRQERLLDCKLADGMFYQVKIQDGHYADLGTDHDRVEALCKAGQIKKLEVFIPIERLAEKDAAGTLLDEAVDAAKKIQSLYEYVMSGEDWWPSLTEYDPGLSVEEYHDLFLNERVVKRTWLEALYEMYQMPDHLGTCKQMGDRYGYGPSHYIRYFTTIATNIAKETNCAISLRDEENARYWPVLFQGKDITDRSQGSYCWKMREPVVAAIEMLIDEGVFVEKENAEMIQFDHNMILYGPPGTGKTYYSVSYAVAICENKPVEEVKNEPYADVLERYREYKADGRIEFTTFHQSYGYEEFIEGIKPALDSDSDSISYTIEDGVFKDFCSHAKGVKVRPENEMIGVKEEPRIWGMILGGAGLTDLKKKCFEDGEVRLGWTEVKDDDIDGDYVGDSTASWNGKHMVFDFKNSMEIGDIVVVEKDSKSIDAIGIISGEYEYDETLKKYPRRRKVNWLITNMDQDIVEFLPRGRKQLSRFSLFAFDYLGVESIFRILTLNDVPDFSLSSESKPHVFIIDEINRGNISKIFGELITLIEDTKRAGAKEAMEATLPYSGEPFSIPENVYILGTMNTADRSIALMDTALRRRFKFVEMMPDTEVLDKEGAGHVTIDGTELNVSKMLNVINRRIKYLFDREHTIGHAFFMKLSDDPSIETLAGIFEKNIIPLLQEYFYEDYEKIQLVLGDNEKEDEFKFIIDREVNEKDIFKGNPMLDLAEKEYEIQHEAFLKIESYKQIGKDL